jgi:hypothetical protein
MPGAPLSRKPPAIDESLCASFQHARNPSRGCRRPDQRQRCEHAARSKDFAHRHERNRIEHASRRPGVVRERQSDEKGEEDQKRRQRQHADDDASTPAARQKLALALITRHTGQYTSRRHSERPLGDGESSPHHHTPRLHDFNGGRGTGASAITGLRSGGSIRSGRRYADAVQRPQWMESGTMTGRPSRHSTQQRRHSTQQRRHSTERRRRSTQRQQHSTERRQHSMKRRQHSTERRHHSTERRHRSTKRRHHFTKRSRASREPSRHFGEQRFHFRGSSRHSL